MHLRRSLGALAERDFRLLFASSTVSAFGDGISVVALAFAVLQISGSPKDLGLVLAARQLAHAAFVLAGGVWADRLPRQLILVGAALVQAAAQATSAALLLGHSATIGALAALAALYGSADGLVIPATTGLVPQSVSSERLQQANALMGLSRNTMWVLGPAVGGIVVAVASPGAGLMADAATFVAAASLLALVRPRRVGEPRERQRFFRELREGWEEFRSRTWLWSTVLLFGIGNFVWASYVVLGPVVAKRDLGGAGAWATLVSASGAGMIGGGLLALRVRPGRPLLASVLAASPGALMLAGLGLGLPLPALAAIAVVTGTGIAFHLALWFTVFQQQVPAEAMSRVSSYDALGSFVLIPLGSALAGVLAGMIGTRATLLAAAGITVACTATMASIPSVRAIRREEEPEPEPAPEPALL